MIEGSRKIITVDDIQIMCTLYIYISSPTEWSTPPPLLESSAYGPLRFGGIAQVVTMYRPGGQPISVRTFSQGWEKVSLKRCGMRTSKLLDVL